MVDDIVRVNSQINNVFLFSIFTQQIFFISGNILDARGTEKSSLYLFFLFFPFCLSLVCIEKYFLCPLVYVGLFFLLVKKHA